MTLRSTSGNCDYLVRCGQFASHAECVGAHLDLLGVSAPDDSLQAAVDAGKVQYDGVKVAECYAGLFPSSCARGTLFATFRESDACTQAIRGTVPAGGACEINEECISQQCDAAPCPDACCAGTCTDGDPPAARHLGDACKVTTGNRTMVYACVGGVCGASGMCVAFGEAGSACQSRTDCDLGLTCTSGACAALPGEGEACSSTDGCHDLDLACIANTCVKLGVAGAACTASPCAAHYACTNGVCVPGAQVGDPCTADSDCVELGYCDAATGRCVAPQPDGAACSPNGREQCASGQVHGSRIDRAVHRHRL